MIAALRKQLAILVRVVAYDRAATDPAVPALRFSEAAGSPQFTHVAFDDFRIISANLSGGNRTKHDRLVPYCMFTDPPLARVGLNEGEARRQGIAVRVTKLPIVAVLRAWTTSETRGFMKALVEAGGDRILGFAMIGAKAGVGGDDRSACRAKGQGVGGLCVGVRIFSGRHVPAR